MPYLYIPKDMYVWFYTNMIKRYNTLPKVDKTNKMRCTDKACYIEKSCEQVHQFIRDSGQHIHMKLTLNDVDGTKYDILVDDEILFVPGEQLGNAYKGRCYLSIFANINTSHQNKIYLGNIFMANYYVVFDMTPYDERGEDFI